MYVKKGESGSITKIYKLSCMKFRDETLKNHFLFLLNVHSTQKYMKTEKKIEKS